MRRSGGWAIGWTAALVLVLGAALPALATAATVEVREPEGQAVLDFKGVGSEANQVTLTYTAGDATHFGVRIVDDGASLTPGPGCGGGGAPGVPVDCLVHRYHQWEYEYCGRDCARIIPGTGWFPQFSIALGDGGSSFEAPPASPAGEPPIPMEVRGGSGNDLIVSSDGEDKIDPGYGHDEVHAGGGSDQVAATPTPDGPDLYDFGSGFGFADYAARSAPVVFRASAPTEVGASGEGDTLVNVSGLRGGSGDDTLVGGPGVTVLEGEGGADLLVGGPGDDRLIGGPGPDRYEGGDGNDELAEGVANHFPSTKGADETNVADGGAGNDYLVLGAGPDVANGGPGDDVARMGAGDDSASGGPGADTLLGDDGNDLLEGEGDGDLLVGGRGRDRYLAGPGDDRVLAGSIPEERYELDIPSLRPPFAEVDSWRDEIDCGEGSDVAALNPWDRAVGCERKGLVQAVELGRRHANHRRGTGWLRVGVASAGVLTVSGPSIRTVSKRRHDADPIRAGSQYLDGLTVQVRPRGAALAKLRRGGRAKVAIKLTFKPKLGFARSRVTHLTLVRHGS
ncbi:MAG TPA: calcium-binding protein [Solirubrobacterales bacterium]|nr:calcium-binding protein [Solirubrobacterales bacterium]